VFLVSVPRSGSTVLSAILDRREDVVVLPESHFPQLLDMLPDAELHDPRLLTQLFQMTCTDGPFLSEEQTEACMEPDRGRTLRNLGMHVAANAERDPAGIRVVVWKATRMTGRWRTLIADGGRFVVLRRNPVNVFESQHRVHFGLHNRNPLRFAAFAASYEAGFKRCPVDRVFALDYPEIPEKVEALCAWIGSRGGERPEGTSTLQRTSATAYWHRDVLGEFRDDDAAKRGRVPAATRLAVEWGIASLRALPFLADWVRDFADAREFSALHSRALASPRTQ